MLDIYRQTAEELLAIPVVLGKSEEKICRGLCHLYYGSLNADGKALQPALP